MYCSWQITSAMPWEFSSRVHLLVSLSGLRKQHRNHQQLPMRAS